MPEIYEYQPSLTLHTQLTFAAYTIGAVAFWGNFIYVFFLGTGLVAIPFSQIIAWADRPVAMTESEFRKKKDGLTKQVEFMLKEGRKLYETKTKCDTDREESKIGVFSYWKQSRENNKKQREFESNCILVEKEFETLRKIAQYKHKVEPCRYTCNFILGMFTTVIFFIIFVHMWVAGTLRFEGR